MTAITIGGARVCVREPVETVVTILEDARKSGSLSTFVEFTAYFSRLGVAHMPYANEPVFVDAFSVVAVQ